MVNFTVSPGVRLMVFGSKKKRFTLTVISFTSGGSGVAVGVGVGVDVGPGVSPGASVGVGDGVGVGVAKGGCVGVCVACGGGVVIGATV